MALDMVLEDDAEKRVTLTQEQEDSLLAFAAGDPVYRKDCDEIIILLGTGLRGSKLCGLTVGLDFANRQINVERQLLRDSGTGDYVDALKTKTQQGLSVSGKALLCFGWGLLTIFTIFAKST